MAATVLQGKFNKKEPVIQKPMVSMFLVRRQGNFKVITNMTQLTPKELVMALIRDAVCGEKEDAMYRKLTD